jgi:hypothetical protein
MKGASRWLDAWTLPDRINATDPASAAGFAKAFIGVLS